MTALEILKQYLGIALTDLTRDTELNLYLSRSEALIDEYMGVPMKQGTYTEQFYFQRIIIPKVFPIISVASLKVNGEVQILTDFYIDSAPGLITKKSANGYGFLCLNGHAEMTYDAGYASPYPGWLNEAWAFSAFWLMYYAKLAAGTTTSGSVGGGVSAGAVKSVTVNDIYSISYDNPSINSSLSIGQSYKEPVSNSFLGLPPQVRGVLDMKRMRNYP